MGTKHYPLLSARAILLAMLALMTWCQPALAQDERTPIDEVKATTAKDEQQSKHQRK